MEIKVSSEKKCLWNSILLGFCISISMITKLISILIYIPNNIPIVSFIIFIISLFLNKFKFNKSYIIMNIITIIFLLTSIIIVNNNTYTMIYLANYIIYGMIPSYIVCSNFKLKYVKKTITNIFLFYTIYLAIFVIPKINNNTFNMNTTMDLAYTSLIGIIIIFTNIKENNLKKFNIVNFILLIFNLWFIFLKANNRGAIIALIVYLVLNFIIKIKSFIIKNIMFIICIITGIIFVFKTNIILINILNLTNKFSISIPSLERAIWQMNNNDILSGRGDLYIKAIQMFTNKTLIGNGIGSFPALNGGIYPHNFILEFLCEFGIILTLIIIILIISGVILTFSNIENNDKLFLLFLFSLSIPRLMLSSSIWYNSMFWMYIIYTINYIIYFKHKNNKRLIY